MPYLLMSSGPEPIHAEECTVACTEDMANKLSEHFNAKQYEGCSYTSKPRIEILFKMVTQLIGVGKASPRDIQSYSVPTNPHNVLNFIEEDGYTLSGTATNSNYFLWTLHKAEPSDYPVNENRPLPKLPSPIPTPNQLKEEGLEDIPRDKSPLRYPAYLENLDLIPEARSTWQSRHQQETTDVLTYEPMYAPLTKTKTDVHSHAPTALICEPVSHHPKASCNEHLHENVIHKTSSCLERLDIVADVHCDAATPILEKHERKNTPSHLDPLDFVGDVSCDATTLLLKEYEHNKTPSHLDS